MCKLKPTLEKWLEEAEAKDSVLASPAGASPSSKGNNRNNGAVARSPLSLQPFRSGAMSNSPRRRRRTSIENAVKISLEKAFESNPRPTSEELHIISESLGIEREVVRVWFCNRRQKQKRTIGEMNSGDEKGSEGGGGGGGKEANEDPASLRAKVSEEADRRAVSREFFSPSC